jgi:hypothetical protein
MLHLHGGQEGPISLLAKSTAERGAIVGRPVEGFVGEFVGELRRVLLLLLDLLGHHFSPDSKPRLQIHRGVGAVAALVRAVEGIVGEFVVELPASCSGCSVVPVMRISWTSLAVIQTAQVVSLEA